MTRYRSLSALLLAALPFAAHAIVDSTGARAFNAADTTWTWVGQMGGASAVAIGAHTVLTAGHVGMTDFLLGDDLYHAVSSIKAPKLKGTAVDLRIVTISDTLPGWYELGTSIKTKDRVTMVGYGRTGVVNTSATGYVLGGSQGRSVGDDTIAKKTKFNGWGYSLVTILDGPGDAAVAGGDSGGGWFANGKLVGISSFNISYNSKKPAYGFGKKGSRYFGSGAIDLTRPEVRSWISSMQGRGTEPVPEPASIAALAVGAFALLRRRRR